MRTIADFAGLCAGMAPGTAWTEAIATRKTGMPALFAYMVDATTQLLLERRAFDAAFVRESGGDTLSIQPARDITEDEYLAPGAWVHLVTRFYERRFTENGNWIPGMEQEILQACPEIAKTNPGEVVQAGMACAWALPMLRNEWLPARNHDLFVESAYVRP